MVPPAKRQKRDVIPSSLPASSNHDDAEPETGDFTTRLSDSISSPVSITLPSTETIPSKAALTPSRPKQRAKIANHPHNAAPIHLPDRARSRTAGSKSASSSPEKARGKGKLPEKGKSGDILKLFSSQIQRQQTATNGTILGHSRGGSQAEIKDEEDKNSISDDDDVGDRKAQSNSIVGIAARKRARSSGILGDVDVVSSSQKFLRKPSIKPDIQKEDDMRPWAERFAPVNLDELAVHKKKVADVRGWLESVINGRVRQRLLVLKGAAGTGKTTTVQLLAKDMGCDVLEWRNPGGSVASSDGFVSMAAQFEEFMGRCGKFGQLEVFSEAVTAPSKPTANPLDRRKSMILVEEFPNTFTRSSTALQSFRSTLLQYLASNTPSLSMMYNNPASKGNTTPLIMVISETLLTTTSASADSFTAHRLLGQEILQHPGVTVIEFNAIAPTLLAKALELVVLKESRKSGRRKTPGPLVLKRLGEIGDVRSAVGSLEFLCVRGDESGDWGAKVSFGKGKKTGKYAVPLTKMEQESLELVTRREASLGIFHAVGKVVYNKRDDAPRVSPDVESLPDYLADRARPKRSQVSVDELIDETGTDTQTFLAALHENYILSCDASPSSNDFSDLDHVNGCIDSLSDSDLLCPSWDGSFNSGGFGGGSSGSSSGDTLRRDEFCFQIAVRGILYSLPNPVKRRAPASGGLRTGREGDAFKMFYPTSLKLWRMKEEIEGTIDLWVTRLMKGDDQMASITAGAAAFAKPKPGSVETWRRNREVGTPTKKTSAAQENGAPLVIGVGTSAKTEMLLERLPYMVIIAKGNNLGGSASFTIKDMEKVTTFTGIGGPSEDVTDEGEEDGPVIEEWATDKPMEGGESPRKKLGAGNNRWMRRSWQGRNENGMGARFAEQKLVLSDDDIEDD